MTEQCPLCNRFAAVINPSIARCGNSSCDVLTFRLDRPEQPLGYQAGLDV